VPSPDRLVVVAGTGTEVGKTWWTCAVARLLVADGVRVAARKPAQSFDPADAPETRDASLLAAATADDPDAVCPPHRSYEVAMAPPMAAAALHRPPIRLADLVAELTWPGGVDVGFVETAGGLRSPIADDGDNLALAQALPEALVVVVADAGLGTINLVRLTVDALAGREVAIALNRYDDGDDLHARNAAWLRDRDGLEVLTQPADAARYLSRSSRL
jgi:dethiobiotin synthetase